MLSSSSRSRKQYIITETAPISSACVASQTRWLAMRCSSAMQHADVLDALRHRPRRRGAARPPGRTPGVRLRAEVVHPLDERDHLLPLLLLGGLLDARVQVADRRLGPDDGLAVELQHEPQHAVRAGVLRPHVDGHRLGAEFRHRPFRLSYQSRTSRESASGALPGPARSIRRARSREHPRARRARRRRGRSSRSSSTRARRGFEAATTFGDSPLVRNAECDIPGRPSASTWRTNTRSKL